MEMAGSATHAARTRSGANANAEAGCPASGAILRRGCGDRKRSDEDSESEPAWHLVFHFWFGRQPEIDAAIVVLLRGGSQIQFSKRNFVMTPRRQVVQRVSDDGVVLNFKLVPVFENEDSLRLVRNRSLRRRVRGRRFSFCLRPAWPRICIRVGTRRRSVPATIEDGRTATVILFLLILLLIGCRVAIEFPNHRKIGRAS